MLPGPAEGQATPRSTQHHNHHTRTHTRTFQFSIFNYLAFVLFNSAEFLLFLPIVLIGYFLLPYRLRWIFVLLASYYFYMCWRIEYVLLIMFSTLYDYLVVRAMGATTNPNARTRLLWLSLGMNLGVLLFFKYFEFLMTSGNTLIATAGGGTPLPILHIILPVGISFYTFQSMAYAIDVYNGIKEPEKHLGYFALFVCYWPQLVAGPIERSGKMLPKLKAHNGFDYDRTVQGLNRIALGFFKKVVVADRLAIYVNEVYGHPQDFGTIAIVIAALFFAFQIYCDFSGYTDIAIGCAGIMGVPLTENFNRPYLSKSITEFWRRWHISLSSWFRDYVYIPLGGSRVVKWRLYYNLFLTFLVSGLWHGANWTFVVWGAFHGIFLVWEKITENGRKRLRTETFLAKIPGIVGITSIIITFALVVIGWVFFRAKTFHEAAIVLKKMFVPDLHFSMGEVMAFNGPFNFALSVGVVGLLLLSYLLPRDMKLRHSLAFLVVAGIVILLFGKGGHNDFIYFQF
jgi:alginate O-acetyltransferase complex protein AlgI